MIFYMIFSALSSLVYSKIMICKSNEDCNKNSSCNEGICQKCLNCTLVFRKGNSCVHDLNQCGECLEGHEEISVTYISTVLKPCKTVATKVYSNQCLSNSDICPPNSFCFQGSCVKCFDCNLYNRLTPVNGCAKNSDECGSCINGFFEVPVTLKSNVKHCEKVKLPSADSPKVVILNSGIELMYLSLILLVSMMVMIIYFLSKNKKSKSTTSLLRRILDTLARNSQATHLNEPPPYTSCHLLEEEASCSCNGPEVEEEYSIMTYVNEEKQQTNMAKIFQQPTASYYCNSPEDTDSVNVASVSTDQDFNSASQTHDIRHVAEGLNASDISNDVVDRGVPVFQDLSSVDVSYSASEVISTNDATSAVPGSSSSNQESSL